jgi:hypothetical protein
MLVHGCDHYCSRRTRLSANQFAIEYELGFRCKTAKSGWICLGAVHHHFGSALGTHWSWHRLCTKLFAGDFSAQFGTQRRLANIFGRCGVVRL